MIGDTAVVTKQVEPHDHGGRIYARGEEWLAIGLDPEATIEVGTTVVIADVVGGQLVVYDPR